MCSAITISEINSHAVNTGCRLRNATMLEYRNHERCVFELLALVVCGHTIITYNNEWVHYIIFNYLQFITYHYNNSIIDCLLYHFYFMKLRNDYVSYHLSQYINRLSNARTCIYAIRLNTTEICDFSFIASCELLHN